MSNKVITVNERIKQWKSLSSLFPPPRPIHTSYPISQQINHKTTSSSIKEENTNDDPYDCSDAIVLPTTQLIRNILMNEHLKEWEELDSRIVVTEYDGDDDDDNVVDISNAIGGDKNNDQTSKDNSLSYQGNQTDTSNHANNNQNNVPSESGDYAGLTWGWHANRIRLPDFFDYTTQGEPPQEPSSSSRKRRRQVVSLEDPTKLLDYECELWKLFKNVPLAEDIESDATSGSLCQETMKVSREIENGLKEYSRLDGHMLNRLRKRDRHSWPRVCLGGTLSDRRKNHHDLRFGDICGATIRFECWRAQLKRGSSGDSNRCEVELTESQTLLDLHNVLVQCSQDDLFTYGIQRDESSTYKETEMKNAHVSHSPFRGYFFIEGTFYTNGDIDYVTPIIQWLDEEVRSEPKKYNDNNENNNKKKRKYTKTAPPSVIRSRREYLGIKRDLDLKVIAMKDAKLGDIPFRLACRYVHVFNGDCESALFFSDVSMRMSNENVKEEHYPLIHDIFTTTTSMSTIHESSICQGCDRGSATVMTLSDEMTDGGPTLLCPLCFAKIHYGKDGELLYNNFEVVPISVLQNLRDLSVGNDTTDALF